MSRNWKSSSEYEETERIYVTSKDWPKLGDLEGYLVYRNEPKGDKSASYVIRDEEGQEYFFFAPKAMPFRMISAGVQDEDGEIIRGAYIRIVYKGMITPKSGGRAYHNFEVFAEVDQDGRVVKHKLPPLKNDNHPPSNEMEAEQRNYRVPTEEIAVKEPVSVKRNEPVEGSFDLPADDLPF